LKVSAHVKTAMQCFEISGGANAPPGCAPALGAQHYKAHIRFLRKLKDFKCALWSEKYGN